MVDLFLHGSTTHAPWLRGVRMNTVEPLCACRADHVGAATADA